MDIIEVKNLEYTYPNGTKALRGIDMAIEKGRKVAFIGANGAGKSTLLLHFNGILKPTKGQVLIEGNPIKYDKKSLRNVRKRVGMVFQDPDDQLFSPTVRQDVSFGPMNLDLPRDDVERQVKHALKLVGMEGFENRVPHFLSSGEKKRVAIAGILAMEPEVLILDEPTSNLDPKGSEDVVNILDELNTELETTIVISSHSMNLVAEWAERAFVMHEGKILCGGTPEELFNDEELLKKACLKVPTIVQVYREMEARGIAPKNNPHINPPISALDFADALGTKIPVRYAIADASFQAEEKVGLVLKEGMLFAVSQEHPGVTAFGKTLYPAKKGEDILLLSLGGAVKTYFGKIHVVQIPSISEGGSGAINLAQLQSILKEKKPERIGAMGTAAKVAVGKLNLTCHYDVDVIHASIAAALRGMNVLIFASGRMAGHAAKKIEENNRKNSRDIKCALVTMSRRA